MSRRGREPLEFPDLEEEFGEEAVRDAASLLRRDWDTSSTTILARIRGIDFFDRIRVFAAVENRMRGREDVLEALADRREELEEIGERDERAVPLETSETEDVDEEEEPDPVFVHEPCGTEAEQESGMAWYCPSCEVRTNRVEEVEQPVADVPRGAVATDGGEP